MSAQILPFDRLSRPAKEPKVSHPVPPSAVFRSFDQVRAFSLPDPQWVSEDMLHCGYSPQDRAAVEAFFAWFGVSIDASAYPVGQGEAWTYLIGEFGPAAAWQRTAPQVFSALCGNWPESKLAYLNALVAGDQEAAKVLVKRCEVFALLDEKMRATAEAQ